MGLFRRFDFTANLQSAAGLNMVDRCSKNNIISTLRYSSELTLSSSPKTLWERSWRPCLAVGECCKSRTSSSSDEYCVTCHISTWSIPSCFCQSKTLSRSSRRPSIRSYFSSVIIYLGSIYQALQQVSH